MANAQHFTAPSIKKRILALMLVPLLAVVGIGLIIVLTDSDLEPVSEAAPAIATTTTTTAVTPPVTEPQPPVEVSYVVIDRPAAKPAKPSTPKGIAPTTTAPPQAPLPVRERILTTSQNEVGKAGPYTAGGFWCAQFVSWVGEQAQVPGWTSNDSPLRLFGLAREDGRLVAYPQPGDLVFVDLMGQNLERGDISHVAIVESVEGDVIHTIEGNGDKSGVVIRNTRTMGDGYVVGFAAMGTD